MINRLLDISFLYALWQYPFVEQKIRPVLQSPEYARARSVLDLGCGPGTNSSYFQDKDYLGIDINPNYIATATSRFGPRFKQGDVSDASVYPDRQFDLILSNSLMHHLDDEQVILTLKSACRALAPGGTIHILDLVMPDEAGIAQFLAKADRGAYARPLLEWKRLFESEFTLIEFMPYPVGILKVPLWNMVSARGKAKDER